MGGIYAPSSKIASEKEIRAADARLALAAPRRRCCGQRSQPDFFDADFAKVLFLLRGLTLPE
jgi:hypothetical protein